MKDLLTEIRIQQLEKRGRNGPKQDMKIVGFFFFFELKAEKDSILIFIACAGK
jgi:hypothetical protein